MIEFPSDMPSGIEVLSSLIDIGICLKDSRDITAEESALVHAIIKKKYKKIE